MLFRSYKIALGPTVRSQSREILGYIFLANLPDIDLLPRLLFEFPIKHGVFTHSLLFAALVAICVGSYQQRRLRFGLLPFLLVVSHLAIDFTCGPRLGLHTSYGVPWFYPFSPNKLCSPITLFLSTQHSNLAECFGFHNLLTILYEIFLIGFCLITLKQYSIYFQCNKPY
jgi:membrane-bound metal-dependent hydrolase YbcI (DUF457 family)